MKLIGYAVAATLMFASAQALAQTLAPPSDTLKAVVEHGVTMEVMGMQGDMQYKPDGTFSGFDGQFEGTYKLDGDKLCITVAAFGLDNQCQAYPSGKKSGDSFELESQFGAMKITIK